MPGYLAKSCSKLHGLAVGRQPRLPVEALLDARGEDGANVGFAVNEKELLRRLAQVSEPIQQR